MKVHAVRLKPGQDLKLALQDYVKENKIKAGFILSCAGSLSKASLRFADETHRQVTFDFEIITVSGTLSQDGLHLHMAVSDREGKVTGGHVKQGCIIKTTAEIILGEDESKIFSREFDFETKFKELRISGRG